MDERENDAFEALLLGLAGLSTDEIIGMQGKRGQSNLVSQEVLPVKVNWGSREQFEAMGIIFGEKVDDLFVKVTLPPGWTKRPTDHSMWSELLDEQGRMRASIFYKAAFYDRDAFLNVCRRYSIGTVPVDSGNYRGARYATVVDGGKAVIWKSGPI